MPRPFIVYLLIINVVALMMCWKDKRASIRKQWRIKESTLLIIAALGGSVGLYLGMNLLRHKTQHAKFTLGVPMIFLLQLVILWQFLGGFKFS